MALEDMDEHLDDIRARDREEEIRSQQAMEEREALGRMEAQAEPAQPQPRQTFGFGQQKPAPVAPGFMFMGTSGQVAGEKPELSLGDTGLQDPTAGFGQAGGFGIQQPAAPAPAEEEPAIPSITDKDYTPSRKYKGRYRAEKESADIAAQQKADVAETQKGYYTSAAEERIAVKKDAAKRDVAYLKDRAQVDEAAENMAREGMVKRQAMLDDINNTKIDTDYFGKSDVGGKIGMVIMAALGGLVQRRGEQNQGVALIQKMIDRDIRAQEANLAKKKWAAGQQVGIYQDSLQIEKDKGKAMGLAHARYWTVVGNKINAIKTKYGDKANIAGLDLLAVQAREKRDEALLKIKGQEHKEGVAWHRANTARKLQQSADAKWKAELAFKKAELAARKKAAADKAAADAKKEAAAEKQSVEDASKEGHSVEAAPDSAIFGGVGYREPLTEASGKLDEKGNPIMQQLRDKDGKLLWGKTKSFKIGKLRPGVPTAAKTAAHNEVTANHTIFRQIADLKRSMREKTRVDPSFMRSDAARELVQQHLHLAVITMHAASGAQTTDKEYHRWTTELIAGPNKVWDFFKGDPMLALEAFEKTKYDRHRTLIRSNYTDINEHWLDNMEEYYNPTVHRVSAGLTGPLRDVMKSIESGDAGQATVALKGLIGKTEKSVFEGTTDEGLDRESVFQSAVAQLKAVDEQTGRPIWQPAKGPEPTGYKAKAVAATGEWARERGITPDPEISRLKAHRGKRKAAMGMWFKRTRISGNIAAMQTFWEPDTEPQRVSAFPNYKPPDWMTPKEIKQVEAKFDKAFNSAVDTIADWTRKTERRGRRYTRYDPDEARRGAEAGLDPVKFGMTDEEKAEARYPSGLRSSPPLWPHSAIQAQYEDQAYEPLPGTLEYKMMIGNRRFAQERKLKSQRSRQ